jgi:hypothetical protein
MLFDGVGCESETAMFAMVTHDVPAINSTIMPVTGSLKYSYKTFLSLYTSGGTFTPDFYGPGIGARNFYYRSGYSPALAYANSVDDFAVRDPEIGDGYVGGQPLVLGGIAIGAMVNLVLNPATALNWQNVEQFARNGQIGGQACNYADARDGGYLTAWTTLAANWDTNPSSRATFLAALRSILTRDQGCKRNASDGYAGAEINSFANSFNWGPRGPMTLTNGSAAVTGTGFTSSMCAGQDTGTITVTKGSRVATITSGTLTPGLVRIYINDTASSPPYLGVFEYLSSGTSVQLAGVWPGASGTFNFMSENNSVGGGYMSSIWTTNVDTLANNQALEKAWACKYNSPISLTLNRPWDAASGSAYYISSYTVGVFNQQPFMLGVKTNQMNWATKSSDPNIAAGYSAILPLVGEWYNTYGYDSTNTKGTFYTTVFQACGLPTIKAGGVFNSIHGFDPSSGGANCGFSGALGTATERVNSAEGGSVMIQYYLGDPTPARRAIVDQFYGAIFGYRPYCAPSVFSTCDGTTAGQLDNGSLSGLAKWAGFYFGMGGFFSNSWPAVRQGTLPPSPRNVYIAPDMGGAASARITVTAPSGGVSTLVCSSTPCVISVDDRQGSHWYQVQHLSSTGQVLSTAAPVLLPLAPQP